MLNDPSRCGAYDPDEGTCIILQPGHDGPHLYSMFGPRPPLAVIDEDVP